MQGYKTKQRALDGPLFSELRPWAGSKHIGLIQDDAKNGKLSPDDVAAIAIALLSFYFFNSSESVEVKKARLEKIQSAVLQHVEQINSMADVLLTLGFVESVH